ncbi:hypothetical protein HZS_7829 [Henneguya salminicola]|nr:hypothetical protein HZS_7829 [Henneguya salminicola]
MDNIPNPNEIIISKSISDTKLIQNLYKIIIETGSVKIIAHKKRIQKAVNVSEILKRKIHVSKKKNIKAKVTQKTEIYLSLYLILMNETLTLLYDLTLNFAYMSKYNNCLVKLLDGDEFSIKLNVDSTYGVVLFDKACAYIKVTEKDYFSLRYVHPKDKLYTWLNFRKTLKKQLKEGPYIFYFFVKFFPPDPCTLQEDLTRYLFVLAIRDLIFIGRLSCSIHFQLLLSSYIVHAEFGDWNEGLERKKYLNGLKFVPTQPSDFETQLIDYHKKQTGLTAEEVEVQYLKLSKDLALYGVELHDDNYGKDYIIGVSYRGLNLFENNDEQFKIFWPELISASFFKKTITIKIILPQVV